MAGSRKLLSFLLLDCIHLRVAVRVENGVASLDSRDFSVCGGKNTAGWATNGGTRAVLLERPAGVRRVVGKG
jgi:hypothetical protein